MAEARELAWSPKKIRPVLSVPPLMLPLGQFADAPAPAALITHSLEGMPALEDAEPLVGATAPDTDIIESTGNKFTRSHSPRTEDDESDDSPAGSERTTIECPPDNEEHDDGDHLLTPNVHLGTPDLIIGQTPKDQLTQQDALPTTSLASIQPANDMVNPLQVLLVSAPPVMGSPTITEEED